MGKIEKIKQLGFTENDFKEILSVLSESPMAELNKTIMRGIVGSSLLEDEALEKFKESHDKNLDKTFSLVETKKEEVTVLTAKIIMLKHFFEKNNLFESMN